MGGAGLNSARMKHSPNSGLDIETYQQSEYKRAALSFLREV